MKTVCLLLMLAVLLWKAFHAWQRGVKTYDQDRIDHQSLYEYLLGNGAKEIEALRPFLQHALVRAYRPLLMQWRLLLALVAIALLTGMVADGVTLMQPLLWLVVLMAAVGIFSLAALCLYAYLKR